MRYPSIALLGLACAVLLTACSVTIVDDTPTPKVADLSPTPELGLPGPPAAPSPVLGSLAAPLPTRLPPSLTPPPWADLNLTGTLVFMQGANQLIRLDLATGERKTLFQAPDNTWISGATLSPDGKEILMGYAPPPERKPDGTVVAGAQLFRLPADGSAAPQSWLKGTQPGEEYFSPQWSPDGKTIYYVHITPAQQGAAHFKNTIERRGYPDGQAATIVENAMWPRLSPNGAFMAYVWVGPDNSANELYVATANGTAGRRVIVPGTFVAVDAPLFSPAGDVLLFSAVSKDTAPKASWLDRLLGVHAASAHTIPSDWWSVPLVGGSPQQLTHLLLIGLYGDFSPDAKHIAFASSGGLYVMNPDGSGLTVIPGLTPAGTLVWGK